MGKAVEIDLSKKIGDVYKLRVIDDVFFEVWADDVGVCEEMLRVILGDKSLTVLDVVAQSSERNLYGRSVRLDVLCKLGSGVMCNIEVQRSNNDNHLKRMRLNESIITARHVEKSSKFRDVPDLYVIYISEFDNFNKGHALYNIDKVVRQTGQKVDDGVHEICVNTEIKDGSKVSGMLRHFNEEYFYDPEYPKMSERMRFLKKTERGLESMCAIMQKYENEVRESDLENVVKYLLTQNPLMQRDEARSLAAVILNGEYAERNTSSEPASF